MSFGIIDILYFYRPFGAILSVNKKSLSLNNVEKNKKKSKNKINIFTFELIRTMFPVNLFILHYFTYNAIILLRYIIKIF